jgi:hypothetical protein
MLRISGWARQLDKSYLLTEKPVEIRLDKLDKLDERLYSLSFDRLSILRLVLGIFFPTAPARERLDFISEEHLMMGMSLAGKLYSELEDLKLRWPFGRACNFKSRALEEHMLDQMVQDIKKRKFIQEVSKVVSQEAQMKKRSR